MTVLDARAGKFDDGNRIPGAKTLAADAAAEKVTAMLPDKQALVVTYCANLKCPASSQLAKRLRQTGYSNVLEYHEGIEGWMAAGNSVEKAVR
jgi:rhodanese-related sulfurtransferase